MQSNLKTSQDKLWDSIEIFWWNVEDFYHFDALKIGKGSKSRWPKSTAEYQEKCGRVDKALDAFFSKHGWPTIIALGEITKQSAEGLQSRILNNYSLISLDVHATKPSLQIALFICNAGSNLKITELAPIVVPRTPLGSRAMAAIEITHQDQKIQCIFCHWQARLDEGSTETRHTIANFVSGYCFEYLNSGMNRNVVIMGDLNEEPYQLPQIALYAHKDRERSKSKPHYQDEHQKRVHLYNCSWRLIGEKYEHHPSSTEINISGTYYWETNKSWHNFDQIIVSGGLLTNTAPYLDEKKIEIISLKEFMPDNYPMKFSSEKKSFFGLSDHLPIFASIKL